MKAKVYQKGEHTKKIIGISVIILLVINVFLFAFRVYGSAIFWMVIIMGAIVAYILPKLNRHR